MLLNLAILLLASVVLFKKLVEQHRVDLLVANGFGLSFGIATYQVRMHFGHVLRDQSKGNRLRSIVLLVVAEANRLESIDRFARCAYGLNVMFVSARRDVRPSKSAAAVYRDIIGIGPNLRLNIGIDPTDIAAVAHVLTIGAAGNDIISRGDITASTVAYCDILGPGRVCMERQNQSLY